MSNLRQAAEQALEALENHTAIKHPQQIHYRDAAIDALRAALAEPEQEPVAWMYTSHWKGDERFITRYQSELSTYKAHKVWPLYTAPPQRNPLTEEEIRAIRDTYYRQMGPIEFARAIEAAHGIKLEK